jgi:hypothetical protein
MSLRLTCSKIMDVIIFLFQNRQTFCFTTTKTLFHLSLPSLLPTETLQPHGLNFLVESGYSFLHYGHEAKSVWRKANSFKSKRASPASPSNRISVALNPISSRLLDPHTPAITLLGTLAPLPVVFGNSL